MKRWSAFLGLLGLLLVAGSALSWLVNKELVLTFQVVGFAGTALVFFYIYHHIDAIIDALGSRSVKYSGFALVMVTLLAVVLGLVNFIAFKHPKHYDTTEGQSFTLSPQTIEVLKGLKEPIQVTTFFLTDSPNKVKFKDLSDGYRLHTDKLTLKMIDPEQDPLAVKQFNVTTPDTVIFTRGTQEKRVTTVSEESLTNALIAVSRGTVKKVCFLEGHGEKSVTDTEKGGMSVAKEALEKQSFQVESVSLFKTNQIPADCRVLVVAGPTHPLMDPEKPLINDWVLKGGRLVFMLDPSTDPALSDYLKEWGVTARNDLVVDPVAQAFLGNAAVPMVVPAGQNKIVENLQGTPAYFPLARSLELASPAPHEGYFETLLKTAGDDEQSKAWGETDPAVMQPSADGEPRVPSFDDKDHPGPLSMAAILNIPVKDGSAPPAPPADPANPESAETKDDKKEKQAMVAVFGDSDFASNAQFSASVNGDLFLNTISYLAEEEDLLAIRPKDKGKNSLSMSAGQADLIFYLSLMFVPAMPLILGIYTFLKKRNL